MVLGFVSITPLIMGVTYALVPFIYMLKYKTVMTGVIKLYFASEFYVAHMSSLNI